MSMLSFGRSCTCAVTIAVVATIFVVVAPPDVGAQTAAPTMTAPKAQSKSTPAIKAAPGGRANPCSIYGEGFAMLPGTDTCVKVGGYVRSDTAITVGR
jgi:hypothetical protein